MSDGFFGLFESHEENPELFAITEKGLGEIADWCRFHLELGRVSPSFSFDKDGEVSQEFKIALLVWFILLEAYSNRKLEMPGVQKGHLFPKAWENDDPTQII